MATGGRLYGSGLWDPVMILAQIAAMQCLYYISLGILLSLFVGPYVPKLSLSQLYDWRWISFGTFQGCMVAAANLTNGLLAAAYLRFVVERAKKCLDFSTTLYFIHLVVVAAYSGFPTHVAWWIVTGANTAATALLGEWLCMQKEMQDIPLSSLRRPAGDAGARGSGVGNGARATELTSIVTR